VSLPADQPGFARWTLPGRLEFAVLRPMAEKVCFRRGNGHSLADWGDMVELRKSG